MKNYLENKVDMLAYDKHYYKMVMDQSKTKHWIETLGITDKDFEEIKQKV